MTTDRITLIGTRLKQELKPVRLRVVDESHKHAGHAGARSGMGHYHLTIVSERFSNVQPLERHRMVYEALGDLMKTDIHALSIKAFAPEEFDS